MSSKAAKRARAAVRPVAERFASKDMAAFRDRMPLWKKVAGFLIPSLARRWASEFDKIEADWIRRTSKKAARAIIRAKE